MSASGTTTKDTTDWGRTGYNRPFKRNVQKHAKAKAKVNFSDHQAPLWHMIREVKAAHPKHLFECYCEVPHYGSGDKGDCMFCFHFGDYDIS